MGRILAIDYGSKRVGLAVTDTLRMIASPLTTVHSTEVLDYMDEYMNKEEVDCVVVGEPKQMNGQASQAEALIQPFLKKMGERFPLLKVERMDERFTSKMAKQAMLDGGLKKMARRNKETVDKVSAAIILQSYLDKQ